MWGVVHRLVADGSTVPLTTQYLDEVDALADEITVIDHGRVIAHDTPDGLKQVIGGQRIRARPVDLGAPRGGPHHPRPRLRSGPRGIRPPPTHRAGRDDQALAVTVSRLAEQAIAVTELSLHLPSLDEVFLTRPDTPIAGGSQHSYLQFLLPGMVGQTIAMAGIALGVNLNTDIEKGIFDRFRSLPISRAAPLIGPPHCSSRSLWATRLVGLGR